jgi:hypothetical protein
MICFQSIIESLNEEILLIACSRLLEWGDGSNAIILDGKVVRMHLNSEETLLAPVGAPGVSADPVLSLGCHVKAPAYNWDLVVNTGPRVLLRVDSTHVLLETISGVDTATNGTILVDFCLHAVGTWEAIVVGGIISLIVGDCDAVFNAAVTLGRRGTMAVSANVNWVTVILIKILGDILHARRIRDTIVVSIVVNTRWVTSKAWATCLAVNHNLGVKSNWGGIKILKHDIESVSKSRGSSVSPARATVLRNVLVARPWNEIGPIDISPVPVLR